MNDRNLSFEETRPLNAVSGYLKTGDNVFAIQVGNKAKLTLTAVRSTLSGTRRPQSRLPSPCCQPRQIGLLLHPHLLAGCLTGTTSRQAFFSTRSITSPRRRCIADVSSGRDLTWTRRIG